LFRTERLGNVFQRIMRIVLDRGCTRPGCDAPPSLCALHHVEDYAKGGETNFDVLTLVCDPCHALVNDSDTGWATTVAGFDTGFPGRTQWIPPKHIDPDQNPLINHRHHPDEMLDKAVRETRERDAAENKAWRKEHWLERDDDEDP